MDIPARTGVYFVRLKGENLVPIDRNPRRIDHCIRVNEQNCKFGQAQNLRSRYRAYQRTFGTERVIFDVLALCDEPDAVERRLKMLFRPHLMRGLTYRANEWLDGIAPEQALCLARNVCSELRVHDSLPIEDRAKVPLAQDDTIFGANIVVALEYLKDHVFPKELIVRLHPLQKTTESVNAALTYFQSRMGSRFRAANMLYGRRLIFVANAHRTCQGCFSDLTDEALQRYP